MAIMQQIVEKKHQTQSTEHPIAICLNCGTKLEEVDSDSYCPRCSVLITLLGGELTLDDLARHFWEGCFGCGADIIARLDLTGDNLTIQCDNCGEIHVIPFTSDDIVRYICSGIVRENEAC